MLFRLLDGSFPSRTCLAPTAARYLASKAQEHQQQRFSCVTELMESNRHCDQGLLGRPFRFSSDTTGCWMDHKTGTMRPPPPYQASRSSEKRRVCCQCLCVCTLFERLIWYASMGKNKKKRFILIPFGRVLFEYGGGGRERRKYPAPSRSYNLVSDAVLPSS